MATSSRLAQAAFAAALLAGCSAGPDVDPPTAVAGDSLISTASKPLGVSTEAGSAVPTPIDAVPTLTGKVRYGAPSAAASGLGSPLSGAVPFPPTDAWNRDVAARPADPASATLVDAIGAGHALKAAFDGRTGVPYAVVGADQPRVQIVVVGDPLARAWPIPASMDPSVDPSGRLSVVDRDAGVLYELHGAAPGADGGWTATAIAAWRLDLADAAPFDAAGPLAGGRMPVFAGLVRRDEASAGVIRHALRITVPTLRDAWVAPAQCATDAGAADPSLPPLGARLRLKADVEIPTDASPEARAILQALKTYGAIVVGVGPGLALEGSPDAAWDALSVAAELGRIRGGDFEVVALDAIATR